MMLAELWENFLWAIGFNQDYATLSIGQIMLRTVVIYGVALLIIRIGKRRFMGGYTSFDILLGFVVGSILSRAITGGTNFFDAIFVVLTLVLFHRFIAFITFHSEMFSKIVKKSARQIIRDGEINDEEMRKGKINQGDLMQALREEANIDTLDKVKAAYLERDGNITIIKKESEPKIVEVKVENGVQIVKIVLE